MTQNDPNGAPAPASTPRRRRSGVLVATIATLGLAVAGAGYVAASGTSAGHGGLPVAMAGGPFAGFMHARGGDRMGGMSDFVEWRIERTLRDVGASAEQIARIREIADGARADVLPRMREMHGTREAVRDILTAPTIDREAAERLRAERFEEFEAVSERITQAMLDAAEVLTPEQREALAARMEERRRGWRGPW